MIKTVTLIGILLLLWGLLFSISGWETDRLKGRVKKQIVIGMGGKTNQIKEYTKSGEKLVDFLLGSGEKVLYTYQQKSNSYTAAHFDKTGRPTVKWEYFYDKKGVLTTKTRCNVETEVCEIFRASYLYDDMGKVIEVRWLKLNRTLLEMVRYEYNDKGLIIAESYFDGAENLANKVVYLYNAEGNPSRFTVCNSDLSVCELYSCQYLYW